MRAGGFAFAVLTLALVFAEASGAQSVITSSAKLKLDAVPDPVPLDTMVRVAAHATFCYGAYTMLATPAGSGRMTFTVDHVPDFVKANVSPESVPFTFERAANQTCVTRSSNVTFTVFGTDLGGTHASLDVIVTVDPSSSEDRASLPFIVAPDAAVAEPSGGFLSRVFVGQYQNVTFFVIGLAVTAVGGGAGLLRLRRRRRKLAEEMTAADVDATSLARQPLDCEEHLARRRARARELLATGAFDEGQFAVLDAHLARLIAGTRRAALDREFGFLPANLVRELAESAVACRLTRADHARATEAIRDAREMDDAARDRTQRLIDGWRARDASSSFLERPDASTT